MGFARASLVFASGLAFGALAACAQAGPPGSSDTDASGGKHDGPSATIDSPPDIDSPTQQPDAPIDSAPQNLCASGATCAAGQSLGSVSGDTDADMVSSTGYQSAWYRVRVTEDDSGIFGVPLGFEAVLTSPSNAHYQLFAYVDTDNDDISCSGPIQTTVSGNSEIAAVEWGEMGAFSNGDDDSRTVSLEVRAPASGCEPAQTWSLVVYGDY